LKKACDILGEKTGTLFEDGKIYLDRSLHPYFTPKNKFQMNELIRNENKRRKMYMIFHMTPRKTRIF
jgi:hypothetical protein